MGGLILLRIPTALRIAAATCVAGLCLSACSGETRGTTGALPPAGLAVPFLRLAPPGHRAHPQPANILNALLVSDVGNNAVEVLQPGSWTNRGAITDGINTPYGNWVDKNGSLYVANYGYPSNVTEYNSQGKLVFTYPGRDLTLGVTTDAYGNVYEAAGSGYVIEYGQGRSQATVTCAPGGAIQGIALDKRRDVFVSHFDVTNRGTIVEYEGGLRGSKCNGRVLPIQLMDPANVAFDRQGRLLVCDVGASVVDIIAPPYTSITGTLGSGFFKPFGITLDRAGTQAYVSDLDLGKIMVLSYPAGTTLATLGGGSGLLDPTAAVSTRNYIP